MSYTTLKFNIGKHLQILTFKKIHFLFPVKRDLSLTVSKYVKVLLNI